MALSGPSAYFMHVVIHDWPDHKAREILSNITAAMERGHSKLLLYETVIQFGTGRTHPTYSDLTMLMAFDAAERTEAMWRELLKSAGLRLTNIYTSPAAIESVLEAKLI